MWWRIRYGFETELTKITKITEIAPLKVNLKTVVFRTKTPQKHPKSPKITENDLFWPKKRPKTAKNGQFWSLLVIFAHFWNKYLMYTVKLGLFTNEKNVKNDKNGQNVKNGKNRKKRQN